MDSCISIFPRDIQGHVNKTGAGSMGDSSCYVLKTPVFCFSLFPRVGLFNSTSIMYLLHAYNLLPSLSPLYSFPLALTLSTASSKDKNLSLV